MYLFNYCGCHVGLLAGWSLDKSVCHNCLKDTLPCSFGTLVIYFKADIPKMINNHKQIY